MSRGLVDVYKRQEQDKPLRVLVTEEQKAFFGGALMA